MATYTYNADGTRASSTDSDTGVTAYGYDSFKRLTSINPPGTGQIDITYDSMDQISSITDENSHSYQYQYDDNGNMTRVTDPAANFTQYGHDLMDRVSQVTSPTGGVSTMNYNYRGQVSSITDANSIKSDFSYNDLNRLQSVTRNSKTGTFTQDIEGVATGSTTPAGRTSQQQSDKLGYLKSMTLPGGETTSVARDTMTRITSTTDPLSNQTQYGYDNRGSLSGVTMPDSGSASYSRDNSGNLTGINDLNSKNWSFTYTPMGRLASATDPLSQTMQFSRDNRGRIATITHPDASTETRSFDNSGNLTRRLYSDTTDLTYTYDALDNLSTTKDLTLTRDDAGRITTSSYNGETFGVSYDNGGRIATATYGGALTVTYSYDNDNRLSRVSDDLSNQIDLSYDADGNPTAITRSNGVNSSMTWDANARLNRLRDGTIIDLQYSYNADGQITSMSGSMPLDPSQYLLKAEKRFTVDAASQLNSSGYTYDSRGRATGLPGHSLNWNDAGRLTVLNSTTFSYNGLNEIITRTQGASTTHFYHNHGMGLNPIVAEEEAGTFSRYYVYTPSGRLLYSVDPQNSNAVAFYHGDQIGSTLALTNGGGTVTDSYAYSPYGELLGHTGSSDQPYTFVGTLGVRQEGELYQMRMRYYDPMTARFLSREPIWPQIGSPELVNPYQYALENPIQYVDTTGLMPDQADPFEEVFGVLEGLLGEEFRDLVGDEADQYVDLLKIVGRKYGFSAPLFNDLVVVLRKRAHAKAWLNNMDNIGLNGTRDVKAVSHGMSAKARSCPPPDTLDDTKETMWRIVFMLMDM